MEMIGAVGAQLLLFVLSLLLMQAALRWGRGSGLFAALPWGILPAVVVAVIAFGELQRNLDPGIIKARQTFTLQVEKLATQAYPKEEQAEQRESFRALWSKVIDVAPGIELSLHMGILAALAVYLRRRYAAAGILPKPEALSHWTAPWPLAWLVLGPVFLLVARAKGFLTPADPWPMFAWNVLVVGLAVFLFQGTVVAASKLSGWWKDPRTRSLVFLALAFISATLLVQEGRGLIAFLLLTGLFEPWMDLRRLHTPKTEEKD